MVGGLGHNNPPSAVDLAAECFEAVGQWLVQNPVVQTEEAARSAKLMVDRAKASLDELEDERDGKVRPLNDQVRAVNASYKAVRSPHESILGEVKARLQTFMDAEEEKRLRALEAAQQVREAAEREAREAEALEKATKEDAKLGVETDTAAATRDADAAFSRFERAEREVARAEKDAKVKVGGGFGRALSVRTQEVLVVNDWIAAIEQMGLTEKVREAILSSARDYRKALDELPDGVEAIHERRL
jgi:hypothetical protein